ncbi:MAG: OmpA family protein [Desulfomicrobium apsheronum]|nr:OmpA family protein [Desulfomicrobium apsheronum]
MRLFYVVLLLASLSVPAWADTICRQYHNADFGAAATSHSAKAFVITNVCEEPNLPAQRSVSLSVRVGQQTATASAIGTGSFPPEANSNRSNLDPKRDSPTWTVWFDFDRAELSESSKAVLDEVPCTAKVRVAGYACRLGSEQHNRDLSRYRAESVSVYLQDRGVTVMSKSGRGECCPISTENLSLNRRVVIEQLKESAE